MTRRRSKSGSGGSRARGVVYVVVIVLVAVIIGMIIMWPKDVEVPNNDLQITKYEDQEITYYTPMTNYETWHGLDKSGGRLIPYRTAGTNSDNYPDGCWVFIPELGCWQVTDIGVSDLTLCVEEESRSETFDVYIIWREDGLQGRDTE